LFRRLSVVLLAGLLSVGITLPAMAGNTTSLGHGIKCRYVLTEQPDGSMAYVQYCYRGV
jgi:hypothetical protein